MVEVKVREIQGLKMEGAMWKAGEGNEFCQQLVSLGGDPSSRRELQPELIPRF